MKKFLIDQLLFLFCGITIAIAIPHLCNPVFSVIFEFVVMFSWGVLCRRILLIPFDLLAGAVTKTAYFSTQHNIEKYEFFKDGFGSICKFYLNSHQTITLLVPNSIEGTSYYNSLPEKDRKIEITYYRFSKLLLNWEYTKTLE